jgi:hypothetical protein
MGTGREAGNAGSKACGRAVMVNKGLKAACFPGRRSRPLTMPIPQGLHATFDLERSV